MKIENKDYHFGLQNVLIVCVCVDMLNVTTANSSRIINESV